MHRLYKVVETMHASSVQGSFEFCVPCFVFCVSCFVFEDIW